MAIHHIQEEDVADAPYWHDIARAILDPWPRRLALAAHHASFEQQFCTPALTRAADWICTWKCALRLWPDSPLFSNQVLRYWKRPAGMIHARGLPAHRAFPDAYVSAYLLRDMLNEASVAQLIEWSSLPGLLPRVRSGPDRGKEWREIGDDALAVFAADRDPDVRFTARTEIERRRGGGAVSRDTAEWLLL
jgi:exodeoxyribonuclease X